jgi:Ca2+-binding RTX toxin-like protein
MSRMNLRQWTKQLARLARRGPKARRLGRNPGFEQLGTRITPAVNAFFAHGQLTILGDAADNAVVVSRDAAGNIQVNGGAVQVPGATIANTARVQIFGLAGNDSLSLDETNGALPQAILFGGSGNDTLIGGSAADFLFGQAGNDSLFGKGGVDFLFGGAGNDELTGGASADQVFGEAGADRMIWNPGDGSDLNEGGAGVDVVEVIGGNGDEVFTAAATGARVRFERVSSAPFFIDIGATENLIVNANGGNDSFSASGDLAAVIQLTVDGGAGDDALQGGNGADILRGGEGKDFIDGNQGADRIDLGAGDDIFQWDAGDGSDVVEGQAGSDAMLFNGANLAEKFDVAANGNRIQFLRDLGNVAMDLNSVERIDLNAFGGADTITVNNQAATGLETLNLNLGALNGLGDAEADAVIVNGTNGVDLVQIASFDNGARTALADGLSAFINITGAEAAYDRLTYNALDGDDVVDGLSVAANAIALTLNGGAGRDELAAGDGNDRVNGGAGDDNIFLGAGDDAFVWNQGDGSDSVEGMAGRDVMIFNGATGGERVEISAHEGRVRFTRDLGNIAMDLNDVEHVTFNALGGADAIIVNDLAGTDLTTVDLNLAAALAGLTGDAQPDSVTINATAGNDAVIVAGDVNGVAVQGLAAMVNIVHAESASDRLTINALDGDDEIAANGLEAKGIALIANGGDGNDVLIGGLGADMLSGGADDDVLIGGPGVDILDGGPGDNIVIQD